MPGHGKHEAAHKDQRPAQDTSGHSHIPTHGGPQTGDGRTGNPDHLPRGVVFRPGK